MQYFDLPELSNDLLKKLGVKDLRKIPVNPDADALPRNCLNNVNSYIEKHGGRVQLGWIFSCLGNIAIKMTAHAVVRLPDNSLICVTPNEYRSGLLKFAPDNSVEELINDNFLPTKFVPLIDDQSLTDYIAIEAEQDQLRLNNKGIVTASDLQQLQMRASLLYPGILTLAKKHTGRNDQCYCGSGKKNKKCCG
ncbi:YecA family protein [Vibrio parahaemolyticus]|uniref:YecA family protein n=2 Tax=Vibrio parahaemolyticus TaxID=670 RepID=UPI00215D5312|nr:SEC-C metal-binding domain-containing protein [Vibrio parahaemolyticus]MCR9835956.1 SEC-C metal-binding domain-containing protein [Vibrio parahaemolyticus]MDF5110622.1 SEC-C metal-binding domain-containing protein [Vibrio parahaemolyticus]MDF5125497.1 SEC-C metal-binding domain-containing protein [Vibrio parahaemolyticus]MDF5130381.1 SEC-C metal-binding domain-containing protein [Vibrio parahaemolyticus]MDF5263293.1 SEC-C metal-binding domain-containing protein [Vibrio parahaemolyticus]